MSSLREEHLVHVLVGKRFVCARSFVATAPTTPFAWTRLSCLRTRQGACSPPFKRAHPSLPTLNHRQTIAWRYACIAGAFDPIALATGFVWFTVCYHHESSAHC